MITTTIRSLRAVTLLAAIVLGTTATAQQPDFSGVWTSYRSGPFGGPLWPQNAPHTDEAREKMAGYRRLVEGTGATPGEFCVGTGMPGSMLGSGGYPMEIIQRPEQITIIYEAHTEIRRIYMEGHGRPIDPADLFPTRNGHSTGRWEGDVLVVETTHLKEALDQSSAHSDEARIVERYRLDEAEDGRKLLIAELTLIDPRFYREPVTVTKTWAALEDGRMLHYECTEPDWEDFLDERGRVLSAN